MPKVASEGSKGRDQIYKQPSKVSKVTGLLVKPRHPKLSVQEKCPMFPVLHSLGKKRLQTLTELEEKA